MNRPDASRNADRFDRIDTPLGPLRMTGRPGVLCTLSAPGDAAALADPPGLVHDPDAFAGARTQLEAYFAGRRRAFDLRLEPLGSPFERAVWQALLDIPYGTVVSYADVARAVGRPGAARAVGSANGRNPIAVIIPCHRVIGADGALRGYGGGLAAKLALLRLEGGARPGWERGKATLAV